MLSVIIMNAIMPSVLAPKHDRKEFVSIFVNAKTAGLTNINKINQCYG